MKKVLTVMASIVTVFLCLMPSQVFAWYTHCVNGACSSSNGGIEVQWQQTHPNNIYIGVLTGVKGLPIGIEDFQRQEKVVSQAIEKTTVIKKSTTQKASTPAEIPAGAGTDTGKENVFSRKQSMSQSKTMGEGIKVDYTLAFVKWIGDNNPFLPEEIRNNPENILKYLAACNLIMEAYRNGKIESFIEKFLLSRNATLQNVKNVKFVDKDRIKNLADTEKSIILTKFLELSTLWNVPDKEKRINSALVRSAIYEIDEKALQDVSNAYLERIEHIKKMKEPISVLQLYFQNKDYAFIKWLAESKPNIVPYITDLDERYIVFSSNSFYIYPEMKEMLPQLLEEFEKAIANKDESVTKVVYSKLEPIKEKLADIADIAGNKKSFLLLIIPVIGIIIYIKIKKKKQKKENNTMKTICIILTFILLLPLSVMAEQQQPQQQQIPLNRIVLPNFINDHCHFFGTPYKVIELHESFVNEIGSDLAPTSCKGKVCWSWRLLKEGESIFAWQIFDSTLPLKISNIEKISKSISQAVKQTESLRTSSSNLIDAAQEFLKSSFTSGKERGTTKERSITESKTQEQAIETNVTPMFHRYLGMALQGPYPAEYMFCISSAVDLFFIAYENDKVNDLVESFVIFKTVKPEDIEFSNAKTMLNRAKFLYSLFTNIETENEKKFTWAQATLFAKILEWPEFASVKTVVDGYIDKVYNTYTMMKTKTTKEIAVQNKLLAAIKLAEDKYLTKDNPQVDSTKAEDEYANAAAYYYYQKDPKEVENLTQELDKAIQNSDQLLTAKLVKPKPITQKIPKVVFFIIPVVVIGAVAVIIIKKRKNQQ